MVVISRLYILLSSLLLAMLAMFVRLVSACVLPPQFASFKFCCRFQAALQSLPAKAGSPAPNLQVAFEEQQVKKAALRSLPAKAGSPAPNLHCMQAVHMCFLQ